MADTQRPTIPGGIVEHNGVTYIAEELIRRAGYTDLVQGTVVNVAGELWMLDGLHFLLDPGPTAWSLCQPKGLM